MVPRTTLILGGARSGKSARALWLAEQTQLELVYVATAQALDEEMAERIARHRADRDRRWRTLEAPLDLCAVLQAESGENTCVLVDCLTLWLSNVMHAGRDLDQQTDALAQAIGAARGPALFVSNELGLGLVPETALGRAFRDAQGRLNQRIAAVCDRVEFVAAGLPLALKS
jgi:adenosylcobinamide kinase/adenosylcobinamide-phosphate guanylyltransferase